MGWRTSRLSLALLTTLVYLVLDAFLHPTPWYSTRSLRIPHQIDAPVKGCHSTAATLQEPREKACILLLVRNSDLSALLPTLHNFESFFNDKWRYPYVLLNDVSFDPAFKDAVRKALPKHAVHEFGTVDQQHWSVPEWLDRTEVQRSIRRQEKEGVIYAGMESYHHMCRYYAGLFVHHPLLQKYNYFWRLEPGVRFYCQQTYDPFRYMAINDKVYGFVVSIIENASTIPTLFNRTLEWRDAAALERDKSGLWDFFLTGEVGSPPSVEEFNLCHFWTNFEIGDLRFFRSSAYQSYFNHLDNVGGFYHERWGDAPIRTLGLGMLTNLEQIHYFEDIAYKHDKFVHCPDKKRQKHGVGCRCKCPKFDNDNYDMVNDWKYSCLERWRQTQNRYGFKN